jgi:chemotaxis response regulator CheB
MLQEDHFYIVAIGQSAGGLPALKELLGSLSASRNASFILIAHLPAESNSRLDVLLRSSTSLQVAWMQAGESPQANCLYLLPPGYEATMQAGKFQLQYRDPHIRINRTIDRFFTSLARDARQRAIGVILSGSGSDGLAGVQEIEKHGGIVLVQHPATAQFDSMPARVVSKDHPDFVASPQGIGQALNCHLQIAPYSPAGGK